MTENPEPNQHPTQAQPIKVPTVINGTLGQMGEVDCYSLKSVAGQKLSIRAISTTAVNKFDGVHLTLYKKGSSWFAPERPSRIAFAPNATLNHFIEDSGQYFIEISSTLGVGSPSFVYQVWVGWSGQHLLPGEGVVLTKPSPLADRSKSLTPSAMRREFR